jgi:SAM-dependent methyltransferase
MNFKDHFSGHAVGYAQARPTYPAAWFDWLAAQCARHDVAWDAGCGNGQASRALAAHFAQVIGTDPSATQIEAAIPQAGIEYRVEPAESPSLPDASVDLVTVAQALHWFDLDAFHAAVARVLRPGGVIAVWTYGLSLVGAAVDAQVRELYDGVLGEYWPPERRHVENAYAELAFPFDALAAPSFEMRCDWTLPQYLDYLRTWSATQRYLRATGDDPVTRFESVLASAWGEPNTVRAVRWPLGTRVGRLR